MIDNELRFSRRSAFKGVVGGVALYIASELSKAVPKAHAEGPWDTEATRRWSPAHPHKAQQWGIEIMDGDDGVLPIYAEAHREEFKEESAAFSNARSDGDYIRSFKDDTMGYCSYSAASRLLFPRPSMETTYYKGKYPMTYRNKIQLLTALATKMTPLGFNKYTWGSNEYRGRLDLFANSTAPWPFVGNRPKPNQGGGWFVDCYNVSARQESIYSDDFNLNANWFPASWIESTYDPYFPVDGQIPDALRGEVDYWRQLIGWWEVPVRRDLVFAMVYGVPLAQALKKEDKITQLALVRQKKLEQNSGLITSEQKFEAFVSSKHPSARDLFLPNSLVA